MFCSVSTRRTARGRDCDGTGLSVNGTRSFLFNLHPLVFKFRRPGERSFVTESKSSLVRFACGKFVRIRIPTLSIILLCV